MSVIPQRRVAVIGGGPAGMAVCRFLVEKMHMPVVFETGAAFGGIWAPDATNKVVYQTLVTNIPTIAMQSPDLDFPKGLPSYITAAELGMYFRNYAEHFDLVRYVRFGTAVTSVRPLRSESQEAGGDSAWDVEFSDGTTVPRSETFDAVVVATGHYDKPYEPQLLGQAAWLAAAKPTGHRSVTHSKEYSSAARYVGRVVLIVGGRASGVDIAREVKVEARWLYTLEKRCQEVVSIGTCTHLPVGASLRPDGHMEVAGVVVEGPPVDDVILATGYQYVFNFLDSHQLRLEFGPCCRYVYPLYMHIVHHWRPSLCFVGIPLAVPSPLLLFEAQARFVASHLGGASTEPAERERWLHERREAVSKTLQHLHYIDGAAWDYMLELTRHSNMLSVVDLERYSKFLALVKEIYEDSASKKPVLPWGDDWYRRCNYSVDRALGLWWVSEPTPPGEPGAKL